MNGHFSKEDIQKAQRHEKMLSITNHQRDANENQNEIPLHTCQNGHHKQVNKQKVLERMWRKGNPSALLVQPQWKTVWNLQRKLKMEPPFDPAIPLLGLYPKSPETPIHKNLCTPMFIAAQFTIAKCWEQPKCPSASEWIKK